MIGEWAPYTSLGDDMVLQYERKCRHVSSEKTKAGVESWVDGEVLEFWSRLILFTDVE